MALVSGEVNETQKRASENRLLFKFACALPLAVAERLDTLVVSRLEAGTLKPSEEETFEQYHADYERGKDICPPINREENQAIVKLLLKLGGKLPDDRPGQPGGRPMR